MSIAVSTITDRIRRRVLLEGIDLGGDRARAADIAREEVRGYAEEALGSSLPLVHDEESTTREVLARVTGFGVLQPYLDDPEVEEIWINAPSQSQKHFFNSPVCDGITWFVRPSHPKRSWDGRRRVLGAVRRHGSRRIENLGRFA